MQEITMCDRARVCGICPRIRAPDRGAGPLGGVPPITMRCHGENQVRRGGASRDPGGSLGSRWPEKAVQNPLPSSVFSGSVGPTSAHPTVPLVGLDHRVGRQTSPLLWPESQEVFTVAPAFPRGRASCPRPCRTHAAMQARRPRSQGDKKHQAETIIKAGHAPRQPRWKRRQTHG